MYVTSGSLLKSQLHRARCQLADHYPQKLPTHKAAPAPPPQPRRGSATQPARAHRRPGCWPAHMLPPRQAAGTHRASPRRRDAEAGAGRGRAGMPGPAELSRRPRAPGAALLPPPPRARAPSGGARRVSAPATAAEGTEGGREARSPPRSPPRGTRGAAGPHRPSRTFPAPPR